MKYPGKDSVSPRTVVGKRITTGHENSTTTKKGRVDNSSTTSSTGKWTKGGPYKPQDPGSNGSY